MLAVDIGTGSCRSALYDLQLNRQGGVAVEYATAYPRPGWAEQNPETVFSAVLEAIAAGVSESNGSPDEIRAMTLDGPLHTCVGLAADGTPVTPILTWEDARAAPITQQLKQTGVESEVYERTGCPLHPLYPSAKIAWWQQQRPQVFETIDTFVSLKAYVLFRLTGVLLEDQATASGSGMLNIHSLDWDLRVLDLMGVSADRLPAVVDPAHVVEGLHRSIGRKTGLAASTPVIVGSSDAAMSSLGSGTVDFEQLTVMVGTSGAVRRLVQRPVLDPERRTFCYYLANKMWFAGGAINNGGIALRWFRDHFGHRAQIEASQTGDSDYAVLCRYASEVPPGSSGLFFLPFLSGERSPYWGSNMRGTLLGLSLHHRQPHVIRALLEGICYGIHSVVQPLEQLLGKSREVRTTGGFARSPIWLQMLADVMGRDLKVLQEPEGSALGAAAFAMHTMGKIDSFACLLEKNPVRKTISPEADAHRFYTAAFERYLQLYWKLRPEYH